MTFTVKTATDPLAMIPAIDPVVYASVTGLLILTAVTAIAVPARRAATVDPVMALREE